MGRSPGVAIAYLYWCHQFKTLDHAYDYLTTKRPCGPKKEAIRGATLDMLATHGDGLPQQLVDAGAEGDMRGTTLTVEERWAIVKKLRLAMAGGCTEYQITVTAVAQFQFVTVAQKSTRS